MLASTFTLSAESFSRLYVPPGKSATLRRYYAVVPISDIPLGWANWLDVNARDSTDRGKVPNAIRQTLTDQPEWFTEYNRGLTVVASRITWDNKVKRLRIEFKDRRYNGILDGGHTLRAILSQQSEDGSSQTGYCNIEIFTGLEEDAIPNVVEARNTSKQVASKSLMNLGGKFDNLKNAIGEKSELISWKENEDAPFDVRELIGMLTALDADSFSGTTHPIVAYSGKEACLKRFNEHEDSYRKLFQISPDILDIWDEIQNCIPSQYNKKTNGKFGALSGVKTLSKRKKHLPFIGKDTMYDIPTGYIYPILASFRAMLDEEDGSWVWGKDLNPQKLIHEGLATDIFLNSVRHSISLYKNANRTGKDVQPWTNAYQTARIYYLEQEG